jgi:hypothetical protein
MSLCLLDSAAISDGSALALMRRGALTWVAIVNSGHPAGTRRCRHLMCVQS